MVIAATKATRAMARVALLGAAIGFTFVAAGCGGQSPPQPSATAATTPVQARELPPPVSDLQRRTFDWFWETGNPVNGLVPDRWPTPSASSIAAVGFGLTVYGVGVENGWISREQAVDRTLATLRFFARAPQGRNRQGASGYKGFYYHFLDMDSGLRAGENELSTVDTALLLYNEDNGRVSAVEPETSIVYNSSSGAIFSGKFTYDSLTGDANANLLDGGAGNVGGARLPDLCSRRRRDTAAITPHPRAQTSQDAAAPCQSR